MGCKKISNVELEQMVRRGLGVTEISKQMKVTKGAVSRRLKSLKIGIAKDLTLRSASNIVNHEIDCMAQLRKVNDSINRELDFIEGTIQGALGEEREKLQKQRLEHISEIRKEISLFVDISLSLFSTMEVARFQQIVIQEIGNVSPETKDRILHALNQRRLIGSTINFAQP